MPCVARLRIRPNLHAHFRSIEGRCIGEGRETVLLLQPRIMPWFSSRKVPPARPGLDFHFRHFYSLMLYRRRGVKNNGSFRKDKSASLIAEKFVFYFNLKLKEEEEREEAKLLPGIVYVHKSLLLLLLLFSIFIVIDNAYSARVFGQQAQTPATLLRILKGVRGLRFSSSASSALKSSSELLARPTRRSLLFFSSE